MPTQRLRARALHRFPAAFVSSRCFAAQRYPIQGWVYSPYRMTDLMRGTLKNWDVKQRGKLISMQVYDGAVLSANTLLYDSQGATDRALAATARITRLTSVDYQRHGSL